MIICFLDSLCFLVLLFYFLHLKIQTSLQIFASCFGVGNIFHWFCFYLDYSPILYGYAYFTLLVPSSSWILKLVCLIWFLQLTRLATENLTFVFQNVVLQHKLVIYPLHTDPSLVCKTSPFLMELSLTATLGSIGRSCNVSQSIVLALKDLELIISQLEESSGGIIPVFYECHSCRYPKHSQRGIKSF